jgi:GNAT superfamily N-acetyltransferase
MELRSAEPGDALAVARVHVRAWQAGYRALLPAEYLERLDPRERAQSYTLGNPDPQQPATVVASEAGAVIGFATTAPARDADAPGCGELCALHVDPDWWGRGVGVALVAAARAHLVERGFGQAIVWVLAGNTRAERFYRGDGWRPDGARRMETVWGLAVEEARWRRALAQAPCFPR